jgi:hypothetical protein
MSAKDGLEGWVWAERLEPTALRLPEAVSRVAAHDKPIIAQKAGQADPPSSKLIRTALTAYPSAARRLVIDGSLLVAKAQAT